MKELLEKIKKQVIDEIIWAEKEFLGAPGSIKREVVIDNLAALIDIPWVPEFVEGPIKRAVIGWIVDLCVEKLNWLTGYDFADVQLDEPEQEKLAKALDAPIPMVAKAAAHCSTIDERINALYELYNIKPDPAPEPEPVKTPDLPQQETIQALTPTPAPTPTPTPAQWDTIL